jgi:hypothetical protein
VKPCPDGFTAGYYWYGNKRKGPGRPPKWVVTLLSDDSYPEVDTPTADSPDSSDSGADGDEEVVDTETTPFDEEVARRDSNEVDGPNSFADQDSSNMTSAHVSPNTHDDSGTEDQHVENQGNPVRYSLRASRHPPDRLL